MGGKRAGGDLREAQGNRDGSDLHRGTVGRGIGQNIQSVEEVKHERRVNIWGAPERAASLWP